MFNKTTITVVIIFQLFFTVLLAQERTVTLKECYDVAYKNHPNAKQKDYYKSINSLKLENIGVNFLPQVSLRGQATYQSDVTELSVSTPFFSAPKISKDQYRLTMDVKQLIYDGSSTSAQKETEKKQVLVDEQKVEVDLFSLKQRINDLYFSVLLYQQKIKVNELLISDVKSRIAETESRVKYEATVPSNLYILQAQLLQTEQEVENLRTDRSASLKMLSELIGYSIPANMEFEMPVHQEVSLDDNLSSRPELKLFEYQKDQLNSYTDVISSRIMPKLSAFGQAGYGRPGLNMLDNDFKPFYMVGLNISWNPINWGSDKNEKDIYMINQKIVDSQKETFEKNVKVQLEKYKSDIDKFGSLIAKDEELITLREKIVAASYSQLRNGTITSTVYLTELNNKTQSQLMLETHKLQLLQAEINYLTTKGVY